MSIVGLRYDIATEEQVVSYPVVVDHASKSEEHDGTEMDPRLGAVGNGKCGHCGMTKYSGCSGHFGVLHLPQAVLMNPVFAPEILNFYNKYMCDRCMRLRNLPEVSEILEDKELSMELKHNKILAVINIDCKSCDTYLPLRKYMESGSKDLDNLRRAVESSMEKTKCEKCKKLLQQLDLADSITEKERTKALKQALQRSAKCGNCNEQPSVLEYRDYTVIVKDASSKAAAKAAKKDGTAVTEKKKHPRNLMEEIAAVPHEVFTALKLNPKLGEAFIKSGFAIPPLNIREPNSGSEDQAQHSKNKLSVKIANVIDQAKKYKENDQESWRKIQTPIDYLYVGQKEAKLFPRDGPDKNLYAEANGVAKNSILKQGVFSNRVDKSTRSVAGGVEGARVGECIPSTKVFEEITVPIWFNRFSENEVGESIRRGDVVAYVNYSPDSHVKKYSLQISPQHSWVQNLHYGSFVERRIRTGDIVLLNRNPTLHKHNIPAVEVVEPKTHSAIIQVPGPVTTVAGLDFDGDELNLIVPVGPVAPVEMVLLHAAYNLRNDSTGAPVYGINQEQIVAMCCLYRMKELPKSDVVMLMGNLAYRIRDWSKQKYSGDEVISLLLPETFDIKEIFPGETLTLKHFASGSVIVNYVANVYGTYEGCETVNRIYYFVQNLLKIYPIGTKTSDFYFDLDYCETMEKYIQGCIGKFNKLIAKYYNDVNSKLISHSVSTFTNIVLLNIAKIEDTVTKLIRNKVKSLPQSNMLLQMFLANYKINDKILKESFCCEGMLTVTRDNQPALVPFTLDGKASPYMNWDRMTAQSLGFVPSNSFGGHTLAALMMLLAYKVVPDIISSKANTSICGSHARKVYINMEPAISDNLGRLVYNGSIMSPSVNGLKMMGKDICMLPLRKPTEDMAWYKELQWRWEALKPYFRYDHNTKVMDGVAFYVDLVNIVKTFVPAEPVDATPEQCFTMIVSFVEFLSERNHLGLEPTETGPATCQEFVMLYYLDPSRAKGKLGTELLEHIFKRIQFMLIVSLAPGSEVGNRQAGNATERHTQESLSSFRSFSRVGQDVARADFERFKKLTDMALRKPPYVIRCLSHDRKLLEPLKHIYRYTSLGNMNPSIDIVNGGKAIRIEIYKANMELESITAVDLYKMLEHYFDRRKDLKYFTSVEFKEETVVFTVSITMTVAEENHFSSIEEISYIIKHVVVKGKSKKYLMDILNLDMYDEDLNKIQGYSIVFEIKDPAELLGLDLRGITLSIPHGLMYMCRGIQACKYSLAQDFNACYVNKLNTEAFMYAPCKTLASIITYDTAPTNMRNISDKHGAVVRKGLSGYKNALRDAALHGTRDMFKEPFARMLYGLPMNRGTTYHDRFIDVNVYRNAKMPAEALVPEDEEIDALPDL